MSFKRFEPGDIIISSDSTTGTVWSNNATTLTTFFTSSTQVAGNTSKYYYNIYQTGSDLSGAAVQFDIAYADIAGSGSVLYNTLVSGSSPSKTIYGQYRTLVLADENASFVFGGITGSNFYAISVNRARFKESLLPGTMTLKISGSSGLILSLTDDSVAVTTVTNKDSNRVYQLVSGSAGTVYTGVNANGYAGGANGSSGSYGWFLPDIGTILLNPIALSGSAAAGGIALHTSRSSNTNDSNQARLFTAISGAASFLLNSKETLSSMYAFVRARNADFNYSENPSFISGSTGAVLYDAFINSPQTYITAVGFYNDSNELLAVSKLSRPLPKNFTSELNLRCKLDF